MSAPAKPTRTALPRKSEAMVPEPFPKARNNPISVRRNFVRGGDILFPNADPLRQNTVELSQLESGGIRLSGTDTADANVVHGNLTASGSSTQNTWRNNRFGTSCGAATD